MKKARDEKCVPNSDTKGSYWNKIKRKLNRKQKDVDEKTIIDFLSADNAKNRKMSHIQLEIDAAVGDIIKYKYKNIKERFQNENDNIKEKFVQMKEFFDILKNSLKNKNANKQIQANQIDDDQRYQ